MDVHFSKTDALLLERQNVVCVHSGNEQLSETVIQAFNINLAQIGFALSTQLALRLRTLSLDTLNQLWLQIFPVLLAKVGGKQTHVPLLRNFPHDIPADTEKLWLQKFLSHFFQAHDQACLFCHRQGTTHVLNPCQHVACDQCFNGGNYSACPVCGGKVDTESPFFLPSIERHLGAESAPLKVLQLGIERDELIHALFISLCERKQALSPVDRDGLRIIVHEYGAALLLRLPAAIPVRENVAIIFGTMLKDLDATTVMQAATPYFNSATDVLRLIAAYSDADPALQGNTVYRMVPTSHIFTHKKYLAWHANRQYWEKQKEVQLGFLFRRFKVAKMARPFRRALLAFMETLPPNQLTEDMLRHRSYWIWLGEFLHPFEYKERFPEVARAFFIVRRKAIDGSIAPPFSGFYARMEDAIRNHDSQKLADILSERPGEFGRRLDLALRLSSDASSTDQVVAKFVPCLPQLATPVLLTLNALLPTRFEPAKKRLYWPKGQVSKCFIADDVRPILTPTAVLSTLAAVEQELLTRFATKSPQPFIIIDRSLSNVIVPFNERTASKAAIQLPRGSTLPLPQKKYLRLFLHWCQPRQNGTRTDLDLSVAFYDTDWQHLGVCSYYQLLFQGKDRQRIAYSSGDFTSAPYPEGATEFVDVDLAAAKKEGIRYAVVVLNNYSGQAFEELERAFSGLMYRDDLDGLHFDPRTVALRFDLTGSNGVFLPMVLDLEKQQLHWLDAYSTGAFHFNNVASSNAAISTICPSMIDYFESGIRSSMLDLALLHAAARGTQVWLRGDHSVLIQRNECETNSAFLTRLRSAQGTAHSLMPFAADQQVWAALDIGDLALPIGSSCYSLRPQISVSNMAAADLLS